MAEQINFDTPPRRIIPGDEVDNLYYQIVILREDQLDLIADKVVEKLRGSETTT